MGTRIVPSLVGLAALAMAAHLWAEEPLANNPPSGNLIAQAKWLRFDVVGGRIVAASERCNQSQHEVEATPAEGSRQKLCVAYAAGSLAVNYWEETSRGRLTLALDAKGQLALRRLPPEPESGTSVEFVQSASQVTLAIGGEPPRKLAADDLWQLLLAERQACEEHLLPMLMEVSLLGCLPQQLGEIETAIFAQDGAAVLGERQAWQVCVEQLGSRSFAERQAADQALRAGGQGVLAFLRQLELKNLSAEQRGRVRTILRELPNGHSDSPALVADWLATDKRVWRALMNRGELAQRLAAAERLGQLCGRPIVVDRSASDESRAQQLAELSRMLADN